MVHVPFEELESGRVWTVLGAAERWVTDSVLVHPWTHLQLRCDQQRTDGVPDRVRHDQLVVASWAWVRENCVTAAASETAPIGDGPQVIAFLDANGLITNSLTFTIAEAMRAATEAALRSRQASTVAWWGSHVMADAVLPSRPDMVAEWDDRRDQIVWRMETV